MLLPFVVYFRNPCLYQANEDGLYFFLRSFNCFLPFTFQSAIHLQYILCIVQTRAYGYFFSHVDIQIHVEIKFIPQ